MVFIFQTPKHNPRRRKTFFDASSPPLQKKIIKPLGGQQATKKPRRGLVGRDSPWSDPIESPSPAQSPGTHAVRVQAVRSIPRFQNGTSRLRTFPSVCTGRKRAEQRAESGAGAYPFLSPPCLLRPPGRDEPGRARGPLSGVGGVGRDKDLHRCPPLARTRAPRTSRASKGISPHHFFPGDGPARGLLLGRGTRGGRLGQQRTFSPPRTTGTPDPRGPPPGRGPPGPFTAPTPPPRPGPRGRAGRPGGGERGAGGRRDPGRGSVRGNWGLGERPCLHRQVPRFRPGPRIPPAPRRPGSCLYLHAGQARLHRGVSHGGQDGHFLGRDGRAAAIRAGDEARGPRAALLGRLGAGDGGPAGRSPRPP